MTFDLFQKKKRVTAAARIADILVQSGRLKEEQISPAEGGKIDPAAVELISGLVAHFLEFEKSDPKWDVMYGVSDPDTLGLYSEQQSPEVDQGHLAFKGKDGKANLEKWAFDKKADVYRNAQTGAEEDATDTRVKRWMRFIGDPDSPDDAAEINTKFQRETRNQQTAFMYEQTRKPFFIRAPKGDKIVRFEYDHASRGWDAIDTDGKKRSKGGRAWTDEDVRAVKEHVQTADQPILRDDYAAGQIQAQAQRERRIQRRDAHRARQTELHEAYLDRRNTGVGGETQIDLPSDDPNSDYALGFGPTWLADHKTQIDRMFDVSVRTGGMSKGTAVRERIRELKFLWNNRAALEKNGHVTEDQLKQYIGRDLWDIYEDKLADDPETQRKYLKYLGKNKPARDMLRANSDTEDAYIGALTELSKGSRGALAGQPNPPPPPSDRPKSTLEQAWSDAGAPRTPTPAQQVANTGSDIFQRYQDALLKNRKALWGTPDGRPVRQTLPWRVPFADAQIASRMRGAGMSEEDIREQLRREDQGTLSDEELETWHADLLAGRPRNRRLMKALAETQVVPKRAHPASPRNAAANQAALRRSANLDETLSNQAALRRSANLDRTLSNQAVRRQAAEWDAARDTRPSQGERQNALSWEDRTRRNLRLRTDLFLRGPRHNDWMYQEHLTTPQGTTSPEIGVPRYELQASNTLPPPGTGIPRYESPAALRRYES